MSVITFPQYRWLTAEAQKYVSDLDCGRALLQSGLVAYAIVSGGVGVECYRVGAGRPHTDYKTYNKQTKCHISPKII
jgi:hypothetical protein